MSGHTVKEYYVLTHMACTVGDMFQVLEGAGPCPHTATWFQFPQETTKELSRLWQYSGSNNRPESVLVTFIRNCT